MRILVIGGSGFVGGRLAASLVARGHQVTVGSRDPNSVKKRLEFAEVKGIDWNSTNNLFALCEGAQVVIHAAGMSAKECMKDAQAAVDFHKRCTRRLASAALDAGVKKFIYLSSAHVYANPLLGTITEHATPNSTHPYAVAHLTAESAISQFGKDGAMSTLSVRLANAFGVPVHGDINCWELLVNDLCKQAVQKRNLSLNSDGAQLRDFISLQEVCRVIEVIICANLKFNRLELFNLGSGQAESVTEIAELIQQRSTKVLGFTPAIRYEVEKREPCQRSLRYASENLRSIGVVVEDNDKISEIDGLLRFCQENFGP